jgi:hypothetical protein
LPRFLRQTESKDPQLFFGWLQIYHRRWTAQGHFYYENE